MKPLLFVHTGNFMGLIPLQLSVSGNVANHLRVPVTLIRKCND